MHLPQSRKRIWLECVLNLCTQKLSKRLSKNSKALKILAGTFPSASLDTRLTFSRQRQALVARLAARNSDRQAEKSTGTRLIRASIVAFSASALKGNVAVGFGLR